MRIRKKSLAIGLLLSSMGTMWYIFLTGPQPQGALDEMEEDFFRDLKPVARALPAHGYFMEKSIPKDAPEQEVILERQTRSLKNNTDFITTTAPANKPLQLGSVGTSQTYVPGLWAYLPHLKPNSPFLQPRLRLSAGRSDVNLVFGIPTIRRPIGIYVVDTIQSLFDNMSEEEAKDVLVVVCITEPWNMTFERHLVGILRERFSSQLTQGSLEIIAPYPNFYPDLDKIKLTLGDSKERVKWRSKQNLDYAFLIMHAAIRGKYYMQLEDDLNTIKGFVSGIKSAIAKQSHEWIMLNFSHLGFIGRLFKQQDALKLLKFLLLFFSKKPCDWLLTDFLAVELCPRVPCKKEIDRSVKLILPTLFQHQGLRSSLHGTINKLKDKYFGSRQASSSIFTNPSVKEIICTFETYAHFDIQSAYNGKKLFWGKNPQKGDLIEFVYDPPISIQRLAFQTGHKKWPQDIIDKAEVEVLPEIVPAAKVPYKQALQGDRSASGSPDQLAFAKRALALGETVSNLSFYSVGTFDANGNMDITLDEALGRIQALRIRFTEDYKHWVILEQIAILLKGH